jgi:hypothetical protein
MLELFYFADYVPVYLSTNNGLEKKTDQVDWYVTIILLSWLCSSVFLYT